MREGWNNTLSTLMLSSPFTRTLTEVADACSRAKRAFTDVQVLAVAKTATEDQLLRAFHAGHQDFAHNRVQALAQHSTVLPAASWHLLGPLQKNKIRKAVHLASHFQALADLDTARRIHRVLNELGKVWPVLVQVNLHPEDGRHGVSVGELPQLLEGLAEYPSLCVNGLMNLAPQLSGERDQRTHFAKVFEITQTMSEKSLLPAHPEISMGMSQDFRNAILEGATCVRLGRILFPPTPSTS